jgi:hypothetical protein
VRNGSFDGLRPPSEVKDADGCNNDAMMMIPMLRLMTMPMMLRTRPMTMTMTMMMLMTMVMLTMALRTLFGRLGAVVNLDWAV